MPIVGASMVSDMQSFWAGKGWMGADLVNLATAIGNGAAAGMIGATFTTMDTGSGPTPGTGTGVGITIVPAALSSAILAGLMSQFPPGGQDLPDLCDGIANAIANGLMMATLTSMHPLCFLGAGMISTASGGVAFIGAGITSNIQSMAPTFLGENWPAICDVVGKEIENAGKMATGQTVITGAPPPPPATPVPCPPGTSGTGTVA